jgi:FdhD protein
MKGAFPWPYLRWDGDTARTVEDGAVVEEGMVRIHVNGRELATFMCTPHDLDSLALGFLRSEGIIHGLQDVRLIVPCPTQTCVDVWLNRSDVELPTRAILTSGCGGGLTFDDLNQRVPPLESARRATPAQIMEGMHQLLAAATIYRRTRGVHSSALSDGDQLLLVAQDVGRHNTLDRLWGACLAQDIDPAGHLILTTGRVSSEMLNKAAKMRVPIVASRTSPTSLSVRLAQEWDMALVGYVRGGSFNVYAGWWRLGLSADGAGEVL